MNTFAPILLSFRLTFSGALPAPAPPDRWFGEDKVQHFMAAFAITNLTYGTARLVGLERGAALATAGVAAGAAGVGKELRDLSTSGHFSMKDLVWDGAGLAAGLTVVSYAR
jgi:uncharacterized protein YfiM (DUF2279 family)